jgi:hypothetical protein
MSRLYLTARPEQTEDNFGEQVASALKILLLPPAEFSHFPAGGYDLSPAAAARLYRLGLAPGWPDIIISYHGLFGIELKVGDGDLSRTRIVRTKRGANRVIVGQVDMHKRLRASGMRIAVCRTLDCVLVQLREWNIPTREAKS